MSLCLGEHPKTEVFGGKKAVLGVPGIPRPAESMHLECSLQDLLVAFDVDKRERCAGFKQVCRNKGFL